ncbi:MAG TPA: cysteine synthase family protein [Thermoanaerobaculia bacterium]|nr:cysteine synthase family protein [Thermoanaerobaculia bacterium]
MKKVSSVLDLCRDTPLVALRGRGVSRPRARLWAKLELSMPGAIKDRVALQMVQDAEAAGGLLPGGTIVESSSGTMAEGLARVGGLRGYRVIIVTDPRIDPMTVAKLRALGATLEIVEDCPAQGGWQRARLERLREVMERNPEAVWMRQYDSASNAGAYEHLAAELWEACGDRLAAVVGAVGSGGSLCGTSRVLRRQLPGLRVVAVDAVGSALFHQKDCKRLQSGHGNSIIPGNLDYSALDEVHWISDGESFAACRELARREGVFAGGSSGAVYIVGSWLAEQIGESRDVVLIMPDRGDRYFETIYNDAYLRDHGLDGIAAAAAPCRLRYGVDQAERWSWAALPHDGSISYHSPEVRRTADISLDLGLERR